MAIQVQHPEIYAEIHNILDIFAAQAAWDVRTLGLSDVEVQHTELLDGVELNINVVEFADGQPAEFYARYGDVDVWSYFPHVIADFLYEAVVCGAPVAVVEWQAVEREPVQLDMFAGLEF